MFGEFCKNISFNFGASLLQYHQIKLNGNEINDEADNFQKTAHP